MEKTMDKKDIKRKFSRTASFTIAGLMGLAGQAQTSNDSQLDTNQKNKLRIENIKKSSNTTQASPTTANFMDFVNSESTPTRTIEYYNSIKEEAENITGAFLKLSNNRIYNVKNKDENHFDLMMEISHEVHHRDDIQQGFGSLEMNIQETFKSFMHREISANIASCLTFRELYINSTNKEALLQEAKESSYAENIGFYITQIEKGIINPTKNPSKENFDAEMSFITNQTRQTWISLFLETYSEDFFNLLSYDLTGKISKESKPENYNKMLSITYNFGGIDFSTYLHSKDIQLSPKIIETLHVMEPHLMNKTASNSSKEAPRGYETTPQTISIPDLSPQSTLLFNQRQKLPETKGQSPELQKLNSALAQAIENEKIEYSIGTKQETTEKLIKIGFLDYTAQTVAEQICKRYGDKAPCLIDRVTFHPTVALLDHKDICKPNKKFTVQDACLGLANGKKFTAKQIDALFDNYEKAYLAVGQGCGILTQDGKLKNSNNPFKYYYDLREAEQNAFTAANYLQTDSDYTYLISVLKTPDNHPEFWDNCSGPNKEKIMSQFFDGSMNNQKLQEYKNKNQAIQPIQAIVYKAALAENQKETKSQDKISLKEVNSFIKYICDEYGTKNAEIIAQAITTTPKKFGKKTLNALIHTQPPKSGEDKNKYQERKNKQENNLKENITKYAKENKLSKHTTKDNPIASYQINKLKNGNQL